jgi:hypothetical protein
VLSIIVGQGGWYSEIEDERSGQLTFPANTHGLPDYVKFLDRIPAEKRVQIQ